MVPLVAVLGVEDDPHVHAISAALASFHARVVAIDPCAKPCILLGEEASEVRVSGRPVPQPDAVFVHAPSLPEPSQTILGMLQRWEHGGSKLYNSPWDARFVSKPQQMSILREHGLRVLPAVWTNDPEGAVQASLDASLFVECDDARWNLKTNRRRGLHHRGTEPARRGAGREGDVSLRALVMDGEILACERTHRLHRDGMGDSGEVAARDEELENICLRAARLLRLPFASVDIGGDAAGGYSIVDVNASPSFLDVRSTTDEPVATRMARIMTTERRPRSFPRGKEGDSVLRTRLETFEMVVLERALDTARGNQSVAAEALGIPLRTLVHKISKYRLRQVDRQRPEGRE